MKFFLCLTALAWLVFISHAAFTQVQAGNDTTICQGGQAQLTATGGGASYYWTSEPFDPSLLIPQQQNPIVSPQVTTMYVVQSNIATGNLILNGSFELGVMGFSSDYVNNQTSIVAEGTYAVVTDAHTVHPNFFCNHDHTSGSGKFMAVNGSGVTNVRVWYLHLPQIQPHHQYEFSTWITSLISSNPALLQFSINGVLMGEPFQAYSSTCDWYQFFHVWESGEATSADISIVNMNTILSGNDFSLDDISFATVIVDYDTVWVTVLPQYNSPFSSPSDACVQEPVEVSYTGNAPDTAEFHWDFDGATVVSGSGPGPYQVRFEAMGSYDISLYVTGDGCASDTTGHGITIGESPAVEVTADATFIPYGTSTVLHGSYSGGQGPFDFYWEPAALLLDPTSLDPQTTGLTATTEFILHVTDQSAQCTGFDSVTVQVTGGPLGLTATADPPEVCPGEQVHLKAQASGGTGNYSFYWYSSPPGFTSTIAEPVVVPIQNTQYHVEVDDGLSFQEDMVYVVLFDPPDANAGDDIYVPHGTPATLAGYVFGGSGNFSCEWNPSSWLVQNNILNPQTINITETVVFDLTITDLETGCVSEKDYVVVIPLGGPLAVLVQTGTPEICQYESSVITAFASGGNEGFYTYTWTDGAGNTYPSTSSITVYPVDTTTYYVTVFDGFNTIQGQFMQTVFPAADFTLAGGQATVYACPYDTLVLVPDPNPEGWSYLWSNGSVNDSIQVGSTGLGYDVKTLALTTVTGDGCENTEQITVIFDFGNCFGIAEMSTGRLRVYPNPGKAIFTLETDVESDWKEVRVFDAQGAVVHSQEFPGRKPTGKIILNLPSISAGIYIIALSGDSEQLTARLAILP